MIGRLAGKACVVTAAGQGIGRAVAEALAREGGDVLAVDLRPEGLAELRAAGLRTAVLDAADGEAVRALAAEHPGVGVLVNAVGHVAAGTILDTDPAELEHSFRINVGSMHHFIAAFLPGMRERRDGSIVNIASVASSVMGVPSRYAYGTTKAAVIGLTLSVARDFVAEGVRCNAISPGTVDTPSLHERMAAQGELDAVRAAFVARQPMARLGSPEEIAALAVMLASDEARFMTGANLIIDGGMSL